MRRHIPNLISWYRVAAALPICFLVANHHWVPALVLCMGGFVSDLLDGYVARRLDVASPDDGFGKHLDVFGDRTIIVAPVMGSVIAGDLGSGGSVYLILWVALMYNTELLFPRALDAANGVLWFVGGYVVTGWQAIGYLGWDALPFIVLTAVFMGLGGLTHTELVGKGFAQAGISQKKGV